jgi:eukaryotic-like serine/threonine-protein kinase
VSQILQPMQVVRGDSSGMTYDVGQLLGSGFRAEVYSANLAGKPVALKWFSPGSASAELKQAIEALVKIGPPSENFPWPMELTSAEGVPGFGYIMPLRDPRYKGIVDMMKRRIDPTFRLLTTMALELSHSFLQLHAKGLCFRAIDFGNIFFDPSTGELILYNDNVTVDGNTEGEILGTPRFVAPELLRGDAPPSIQTDLFSLSVLLFYLLVQHHPLEGKRESSLESYDHSAMMKLYGTDPLFVFDPDDCTNEPVPGHHDNAITFWPIYPKFLRDTFTRAFTQGLRDPKNGRVSENEWRAVMVRLRDSILYCRCGSENFYDAAALQASGGKPGRCWSCRKEIQLPARIRIGKNVVMLNHDTQLFPHHVDEQKMYDFAKPVAEITRHPTNPSIWGLKNVSDEKWVSKLADGTPNDVEPGRSLSLAIGTKIFFGTAEGEIRV